MGTSLTGSTRGKGLHWQNAGLVVHTRAHFPHGDFILGKLLQSVVNPHPSFSKGGMLRKNLSLSILPNWCFSTTMAFWRAYPPQTTFPDELSHLAPSACSREPFQHPVAVTLYVPNPPPALPTYQAQPLLVDGRNSQAPRPSISLCLASLRLPCRLSTNHHPSHTKPPQIMPSHGYGQT